MTKKLFFSMAIGAVLLGSCTSEEPVVVNTGGNVTFKTSLPSDIMSRSVYDDGLTATNLEYAVYDQNGANIPASTAPVHSPTARQPLASIW